MNHVCKEEIRSSGYCGGEEGKDAAAAAASASASAAAAAAAA